MASQTPPSSQLIASQPHALNVRGDLVTTRILESVGVAINTELQLYICLPCGSAYTHSNDFRHGILNHLQHEHDSATTSTRNHIVERTHGFQIMEEYPSIDPAMVARLAFSGIHITMDQFGCLHCPYAASEKVVQKHMREKHEDRKGKPSSRLCTQVLNSGAPGANTRIRVVEQLDDDDDEPPAPASSPLTQLTPTQGGASTPNPSPPPSTQRPTPAKSLRDLVSNFDPKDYRAEELPNARMISPWLMRNGWHKHLEPYRKHDDELIRLASVPSDDEIPGLRKAVASYFTEATNLIEHTNEVVLQRLNSADPNKDGINNTPLHNHHQGDKTFGQYINVIVRLLASLLREPEHYRMPVTEQLKSAVQSALTSFTDSVDITEHCSELHQILLALSIFHPNWSTCRS
ncbi:hypothetical protein C8F04DRAFT_1313341 [Mycena alexandri]|uniref:C2H2-type domain-containing protein n=1 Tax=Mycena alexandri TaxID=1745969 RepID=A0AAD6S7P0_9AGAR|nr:hypothetical protein C8F04DRAFT_1313341 [Mycena alexandri]